MIKKVMVSIDETVLADFDKMRGIVTRSAYIVNLMRIELNRKEKLSQDHQQDINEQ